MALTAWSSIKDLPIPAANTRVNLVKCSNPVHLNQKSVTFFDVVPTFSSSPAFINIVLIASMPITPISLANLLAACHPPFSPFMYCFQINPYEVLKDFNSLDLSKGPAKSGKEAKTANDNKVSTLNTRPTCVVFLHKLFSIGLILPIDASIASFATFCWALGSAATLAAKNLAPPLFSNSAFLTEFLM